jgi:hypothetical protein
MKMQPNPPNRCPVCGGKPFIDHGQGYYVSDWARRCRPGETVQDSPASKPRPSCKEAGFFYDQKTLDGFYSGGQPSLHFTREQLVLDFVRAIQDFEKESERATPGVRTADAPFIAQAFDSGALPTGREERLREEARALAARKGERLGPGDLFLCALKATGGNVRDALVTAHAALYRDGPKVNKAFIDQYLQPIRDPAGYSDKASITVWNAQLGREEKVVPRDSAGSDQQGVWYHLFGMAALELTDRHGLVPVKLVETAAGVYKPEYAKALGKKGYPVSDVCGGLSSYAIALENEVRSGMRRAPDPDKQCVNYAGAAVGTALAKYLSLPTERGALAKLMNIETQRQRRRDLDFVWLMKSPLSVEFEGEGGLRLAFDQRTKLFEGTTDLALLDVLVEEDGTWGLVAAPLFPVRRVTYRAVEEGDAVIAVHDLQHAQVRGWAVPVRPDEIYVMPVGKEIPLALQREGGGTVSPSFEGRTAAATQGAPAPRRGGRSPATVTLAACLSAALIGIALAAVAAGTWLRTRRLGCAVGALVAAALVCLTLAAGLAVVWILWPLAP